MGLLNGFVKGGACCVLGVVASSAYAGAFPIVLDFETEDDFSTPLLNGQIIDPAFDAADLEFGNLVNISSRQSGVPGEGHLGVTVFDSDAADQPSWVHDPDLLVGQGNILILQNDFAPGATVGPNGLQYDAPDDESNFEDRGSIVFDFVEPVALGSIDLIDIDDRAGVTLTLYDIEGLTRTYQVGANWTTDLVDDGPTGVNTLDLTILTPQAAAAGATGNAATGFEDPNFDPTNVVKLDVAFTGSGRNPGPSAGLDNLTIVPEPGAAVFAGLAGLATLRRRR